jgi:hypothetical protein
LVGDNKFPRIDIPGKQAVLAGHLIGLSIDTEHLERIGMRHLDEGDR